MIQSEDAFDRAYKKSRRFFTSPYLFAGMALVMGLFALLMTLSVILQPMPAQTRFIGIVIAIVLWLFAGFLFNFWRKWRVVSIWVQDREVLARKAERVKSYYAKMDDGGLPPEIRQDLQDLLEAFHREWRD